MSRIPPDNNISLPQVDSAANTRNADTTTTIGSASSATMSSLFQVMAHRPEIMRHALALLEATMRTGTVEPRLKELLAVRVSQVNHCFY